MDEWYAYFWPNSNVFKNKAGLTNAETLQSFEHEASRERAGEFRTVEFSKGGSAFAPLRLPLIRSRAGVKKTSVTSRPKIT
jgi:hypothetical protein